MPRPLRLQSAGLVHHVITKGNDGQDIFKSKSDFTEYISLLEHAKNKYPLNIYNYVLMSTHVHLLVEPTFDGSLSKVMEYVSKQYAKYFNHKYNRTGHVFEGRFKSFVVQTEKYFFACSRYIDLNPVKAGIVSDPKKYQFSAYSHLTSGEKCALKIDKHEIYKGLGFNDMERQIGYRSLVLNYQGEEVDLMSKRAGILGDKEFKKKIKGRK